MIPETFLYLAICGNGTCGVTRVHFGDGARSMAQCDAGAPQMIREWVAQTHALVVDHWCGPLDQMQPASRAIRWPTLTDE